jgi:hypothetical protein
LEDVLCRLFRIDHDGESSPPAPPCQGRVARGSSGEFSVDLRPILAYNNAKRHRTPRLYIAVPDRNRRGQKEGRKPL